MSSTKCEKPSPTEIGEAFGHMVDIGCCDYCAHLYSGKSSDEFYENHYNCEGKNPEKMKKNKPNPCISCLGLLESPYRDQIVDQIVAAISKSENDYDSFNLALSLPISHQMRAHSLAYYTRKKYPQITEKHNGIFPWINIKDIFKVIAAPEIAKRVNKSLKYNSELKINVKLMYKNDELECYKLLELCPDVFGHRNAKKFRGFLFSRKAVDDALHDPKNVKLQNYYSKAPSVPNHEIQYESMDVKQNSMFCAGRYNKYSRTLPQTPWFINGKRRFNTSLQELFSPDIQKLFKAQDYTFSSSGREDVDVRMLGNGRPFSLEIINPARTKVSSKDLKDVMDKINKEHGENIHIRDLQIISKNDLKLLKAGEEEKKKTYEALCVSRVPLSNELLLKVGNMAPFDIKQKTPIRVLHRRANMVRAKRIHSLELIPVQQSNPNQTFFTLKLVSQAGTYIKEFVNGDLNRTLPNLRSLLESPSVDILALDVVHIHLDWPPKHGISRS